MNKGPNNQYVLLSGDELDCLGGPGNKGRNYSLISDADNGYYWFWNNACSGAAQEWAMCLFVCDTVTIPVNAPSNSGPFAAYGFDVGSPTVTPLLSSNCIMLGFMTELRCPAVCRQREDGSTACEIRKCCRSRGFYTCHECDDFEGCDTLKSLEPLHGDSCVVNLRAIREMGPDAWVASGKRLWFGSDVD